MVSNALLWLAELMRDIDPFHSEGCMGFRYLSFCYSIFRCTCSDGYVASRSLSFCYPICSLGGPICFCGGITKGVIFSAYLLLSLPCLILARWNYSFGWFGWQKWSQVGYLAQL